MARLTPKTRLRLWRLLYVVMALTLGWVVWKRWIKPWLYPPSPLVHTPRLGLEQLQSKSLYYSGEARLWLLQMRPDLLAEDDRDEAGQRAAGYAQATQELRLFRSLDRKYHFDTVLLLGDPSNFQRLMNHLIELEPEKRDFRLVYLDHWMFVFKRGAAREWQPTDAEPLKKSMASLHSEERAAFLAKAAERMLAVGQKETAKAWLDEALAADSSSVDALSGLAGYYAILAKWPETEAYADKALDVEEDFKPALQRKFIALVGTKHLVDAFKVSQKLLNAIGDSPGLLWQHAMIAHQARQYQPEIEALSRLVILAEKEHRPTGEYEFALGEAHTLLAREDDQHAPRAREHFQKALRDEGLSPEMRKTAIERLRTIQEKIGGK